MLSDNYAYLIIDNQSNQVAVVDPSAPSAVLAELENQRNTTGRPLRLSTILTTHKHWDHAGGNTTLCEQFPSLRVVGSCGETVASATHNCTEGDVLELGGTVFEVMDTPGHTHGHIAYVIQSSTQGGGAGAVFTGDCLFIGGIGKLFEGKASEMSRSLRKLQALRGDTFVFPGHEYTLQNLQFAAWVEPQCSAIQDKLQWARTQRLHGASTVPSTIKDELGTNPYMRTAATAVLTCTELPVGSTSPEVIQKLRLLKDQGAHFAALEDTAPSVSL